MKIKLNYLIVLLFAITFNYCCTQNNEKAENNEKQCCNDTSNQQIVVEFTSNVVKNEYIVQFKNYYTQDSRNKFIKSALDNIDVS